MNTSLLITSAWIISFSVTLYLIRKGLKKDTVETEHSTARRLWETTHSFSEWAEGKRAKLFLVKNKPSSFAS